MVFTVLIVLVGTVVTTAVSVSVNVLTFWALCLHWCTPKTPEAKKSTANSELLRLGLWCFASQARALGSTTDKVRSSVSEESRHGEKLLVVLFLQLFQKVYISKYSRFV